MDNDGPMYSPSRERKNKSVAASTGFVFTFLLLLIILLGGGVAWLYLRVDQQQSLLRTRFLTIDQNQSLFKEALKITDENFVDIETSRKERLETLDDEIRKLWNIANGRNKKQIKKLESDLASTNKSVRTINETLKLDHKKVQQLVEHVENLQATTNTLNEELGQDIAKLVEVQKALGSAISRLEEESNVQTLKNIDQRIAALENQQGGNNVRMGSLQQDINLLRSRLLALESSLRLPTNLAEPR